MTLCSESFFVRNDLSFNSISIEYSLLRPTQCRDTLKIYYTTEWLTNCLHF